MLAGWGHKHRDIKRVYYTRSSWTPSLLDLATVMHVSHQLYWQLSFHIIAITSNTDSRPQIKVCLLICSVINVPSIRQISFGGIHTRAIVNRSCNMMRTKSHSCYFTNVMGKGSSLAYIHSSSKDAGHIGKYLLTASYIPDINTKFKRVTAHSSSVTPRKKTQSPKTL
jgi:hypothetical protein